MENEIHYFSDYEVDALKDFLEKKALKGWKLYSKCGIFFHFKKIEPCKLNYLVVLSKEDVLQKYKKYIVNDKYKDLNTDSDSYDKRWHYICKDKNISICCFEDTTRLPEFEYSEDPLLITKNERVYRYFSIIEILLFILYFATFQIGEVFGSSKCLLINAFILSLVIWDIGKLFEVIYHRLKSKSKSVLIHCRKIRIGIEYFLSFFILLSVIASSMIHFSVTDLIFVVLFILVMYIAFAKRANEDISSKNAILYAFKTLLTNFIYFSIITSILLTLTKVLDSIHETRVYTDDEGYSYDINNDNIYVTLDDLGVKTNDGYGTDHFHSETIFSKYGVLKNQYEANDDDPYDDYLTVYISRCKIKPIYNIIKECELSNDDYSIFKNYNNWNQSIKDAYICSDNYIDDNDSYYYVLLFKDKVIKVEVNFELSYENLNLIAEKTALIN